MYIHGAVYAVASAMDQVRNLDKQYPARKKMSNKFFIPKKGDTVRVRLIDGDVVNAMYLSRCGIAGAKKWHFVKVGETMYTVGQCPDDSLMRTFVGPSADMVPV